MRVVEREEHGKVVRRDRTHRVFAGGFHRGDCRGKSARRREAGSGLAAPYTARMEAVLSRRCERTPRIAVVLPGLGSGGLERVVADLARALPGRGYEPGVFCTSKL